MFRLVLLILICFMLPTPLLATVEVRVALDQSPPTSFLNEQGKADGFFPGLFNQMAPLLDWKITYVPCAWEQCLEQLQRGEVDVLPGIAYTEARASRYNFSSETTLSSWGEVFGSDAFVPETLIDLNNRSLAVLSNDVYLQGELGLLNLLRQFDLNVQLIEVASYEDAFAKVTQKQADAALVGRIFGLTNSLRYRLHPTPILVKPIKARPAFSAQRPPQLRLAFDRLLRQWKENPQSPYYRLQGKWLSNETQPVWPAWLQPALYACAISFVLLLSLTLLIRKQLQHKSRLLQKEAQERQQQYQFFFEKSHCIILFVDPDTGLIVAANQAACDFYQYSQAQLQKMNISQINNLSDAELHQALQSAQSKRRQYFEFTHAKANGETCPVEVYSSPIQIEGQTLLGSIILDTSQRQQAQQKLADYASFLQSIIDGVSDPLLVISTDYQIQIMNKAAQAKINPQAQEPTGRGCCYQFIHQANSPCRNNSEYRCSLHEVLDSDSTQTLIHHINERIYEITASPLRDAAGNISAIIEVSRDITDRLKIEELLNENEKRLLHLAHHDALTGLPNRMLFEDRLKQALRKTRRSHHQLALLFLDLDNFKAINDNLGHDYGDRLLIDVANRLRSCIRESDTVARMGGDEFLILIDEIDAHDLIEKTAQRINNALCQEVIVADFRQPISCSIGISIYPEDADTWQELLKKADIAMYKAKKEGRANFQFYATPQASFIFD